MAINDNDNDNDKDVDNDDDNDDRLTTKKAFLSHITRNGKGGQWQREREWGMGKGMGKGSSRCFIITSVLSLKPRKKWKTFVVY